MDRSLGILAALALAMALTAACSAGRGTAAAPPTATSAPPTAAPPPATPVPLSLTAPPTAPLVPTATPTNIGQADPTTLAPAPTAALAADAGFLTKPAADAIRVMSYNVNWDSIFPADDAQNHDLRWASREAAFPRLLAAIRPDVVCLQEINPERDPAQIAALIGEVLGQDGGGAWSATSRRDSAIAARFPVRVEGYGLNAPLFPQELAQAAALVDLPDEVYGAMDLYVVCAHFKSGGNVYDRLLRQRQADVIAGQIGDALSPGGELDLPAGTPLVLLGDFNIYATEPAEHLNTLLTGDIEHEDQYGPDVRPDWDGTALADAQPSHNGLGIDFYTWRDDSTPLDPGALDRIFYSDSVLTAENAFVLNTTLLAEAALAEAGLGASDVLLEPGTGTFDHLPLVVDFAVQPAP